jgi:hypothetical protein
LPPSVHINLLCPSPTFPLTLLPPSVHINLISHKSHTNYRIKDGGIYYLKDGVVTEVPVNERAAMN